MSRVVVINHLTLDGVMQAPGRPDEDTRDGFAHGGWSAPNADDQLLAATYARVAESGGLRLLLGRRSYEDMLGYWNTQDSPFKDGLNNAPNTWHPERYASRSPGPTRRSSTATSPRPSRNSSAH
jgi:dihydrofolate reductase